MSIQSKWLPASRKQPAELELDYATIKVQAISMSGTNEIQVRLSTKFNTDWQQGQFEEWASEWENNDRDEALEAIYPLLRRLRTGLDSHDRALVDVAVNELERCNSGLIRG